MKLPLLLSLFILTAAAAWPALAISFVAPSVGRDGEVRVGHATTRIRFNGHTDPEATLTLNGERQRVWPTGAFAGLLRDLETGENVFTFTASARGERVTRTLRVVRAAPPEPLPPHPPVIERGAVSPSSDVMVMAGDTVRLRLRGSPQGEASARLGDLRVALAESSNRPGEYRGEWVVVGNEGWERAPIRFDLRHGGEGARQMPEATLTLLEEPIVRRVRSADRLHGPLYPDTDQSSRLADMPEGTHLEITGLRDRHWRVRLTPTRHAWIPANDDERFTAEVPEGTPPPRGSVQAMTMISDPRVTMLSIALDQPLPFIIEGAQDDMLTITFFGVEGEGPLPLPHFTPLGREILRGVQWLRGERGTATLVLTLGAPLWGWNETYDGSTLLFELDRGPEIAPGSLEGIRIVLDPGHGGRDTGAKGSTGVDEKEIVLRLSTRLRDALRAEGAQVTMLRTGDTSLGLNERVQRTQAEAPDLFLSIHANSIGMSTDPLAVTGAQMYHSHPNAEALARTIQRRVTALEGVSDAGVRTANFRVTRPHQRPSVLAELLFLPNPEDEMKLLDDAWQRRLAEALAAGVEDWVESFRREREASL